MTDPTQRFSTRVENYVRYRPGYPAELIGLLEQRGTLRSGDMVADLGFGTGKLTAHFLERGYRVHALEPNAEMRAAGAALIRDPHCVVSSGRAEITGLPDASIDLAVAAQAFHWFDVDPTLLEWARILRPDARVALIWNVRDEGGDAFMGRYEAVLAAHGSDYRNVGAHGVDATTRERLFGSSGGLFDVLPNEQRLDRKGLLGRVLSASYAPELGAPGYDEMVAALDALFESEQRDGHVVLRYRTEVYHGEFHAR